MTPDLPSSENSGIDEDVPCIGVLPTGNERSIPTEHLPSGKRLVESRGMNIEDVRQSQLRKLRAKFETNEELAAYADVAASSISRLLSSGKNRKRMGEELARRIEEYAGLPYLWFDQHEASATALRLDWPFSFARSRFDKLTPRDREKIDQAVQLMLSLCEDRGSDQAVKRRAA